jgi:hypothetical protein
MRSTNSITYQSPSSITDLTRWSYPRSNGRTVSTGAKPTAAA